MPWYALAWYFLKELVSGEIWRLWNAHKAAQKSQAVADSPVTDAEWLEAARHGEL